MQASEIEEFARLLVKQVRDPAIQSCDRLRKLGGEAPIAKRWSLALGSGDSDKVAEVIVPDCVDETVFYLLQAIDQGLLQLSFTASNGKTVDLPSDGAGELSGWYMSAEGWRDLHSAERFADDFSDMAG